jgi:hypothetical protein
MKCSELIKDLQANLKKHGDLAVEISFDAGDEETGPCEVFEPTQCVSLTSYEDEKGLPILSFAICGDSVSC